MEPKVLVLSSNSIGKGSEELGAIAMKNFIATLIDSNPYTHIIFMNLGVKLICDTMISDDLNKLNSELLACGTCLSYYQLEDELKVGSVTNMVTISKLLGDASKVVVF